jgi:hypothetical protein
MGAKQLNIFKIDLQNNLIFLDSIVNLTKINKNLITALFTKK